MSWTNALPLRELPAGEARQLDVGGREYLLCRDEEGVYALDNECPHAGGPLAMGNFSPPLIACPWHAWEFDCRTGKCIHSAEARVACYPVEVRGGEIWVDLPDAG